MAEGASRATEVIVAIKPVTFGPMAQGGLGLGLQSIVMRGPNRTQTGCRSTDTKYLGEDVQGSGSSEAPGGLEEKRIWDLESPGEEDFNRRGLFEAEKSETMSIVARHKTCPTTREPR